MSDITNTGLICIVIIGFLSFSIPPMVVEVDGEVFNCYYATDGGLDYCLNPNTKRSFNVYYTSEGAILYATVSSGFYKIEHHEQLLKVVHDYRSFNLGTIFFGG